MSKLFESKNLINALILAGGVLGYISTSGNELIAANPQLASILVAAAGGIGVLLHLLQGSKPE